MGDHLAESAPDRQPSGPDPAIAELVAARICHDLVGPVGAVGNGLDLVRAPGGEAEKDLALIGESAARAASLLRLHRLAFGPLAEGDGYGRQALADRIVPALASRRIAVAVEGAEGPALSPALARLAALMAMAARALTGLEGRVLLTLAPDAGLPISAMGVGSRAAWTPALAALAGGDAATATSREVEFALLPVAARAAAATLGIAAEPGQAGLRADAR